MKQLTYTVVFLVGTYTGFHLKTYSPADKELIKACEAKMKQQLIKCNKKLLQAQVYLDSNNVVYLCNSDSSKCKP